MLKSRALKQGDRIAIVSLSSGMLGEDFCKHNLDIGIKRLRDFGLNPVFMENTLKGVDFIKENPQLRAMDLKTAFMDKSIKGIFCAIGGLDTYKTIPYLLDDEEFILSVKENPKLFLGFSDSTTNHLMFYKLGLTTFYGQAFIPDIADIGNDMLPFTKKQFLGLFEGQEIKEIVSSDTWYDERTDFSVNSVGVDRIEHIELRGYEILQGNKNFRGRLLGGCIETLMDGLFVEGIKEVYEKYEIFPNKNEWVGKVMFLESSEVCIEPKELKVFLNELKSREIFDVIRGIIVGKPQNEVYYEEYKKVYSDVVDNKVPIMYNVNFGHALPRCILPLGVEVEVDILNKRIIYTESIFD